MQAKFPASSISKRWIVFPSISFTEKSVAVVRVVWAVPIEKIKNSSKAAGIIFFINTRFLLKMQK